MSKEKAKRIFVTGIVQGVGFRPFVHHLAEKFELRGWVRNTSAGVEIHLEGEEARIKDFVRALKNDPPPLALIDSVQTISATPQGMHGFEIIPSKSVAEAFQPISPDVGICEDCLAELFDVHDRRYLYPFINCTNCGPRFTIIRDIPYDRPKTTMAQFPMCTSCAAEYENPNDRRFHAQPVACAVCGPHIWLEIVNQTSQLEVYTTPDPHTLSHTQAIIQKAQQMIQNGMILAIKGLGGFHLACDARNTEAVEKLRQRKLRIDKPFALMMPDLATVREHCYITPQEEKALISRQRPILLLPRRPQSDISPRVAPQQSTLGVMLPYTPLHYLIFSDLNQSGFSPIFSALVMTSGNLSEEPIAKDNEEARDRLHTLADAFLMHNRPIHTRCDDSVYRLFSIGSSPRHKKGTSDKFIFPLRRSRSYAPFPIRLAWESQPILATGAELKNTFCLTRDKYAFISHHIGDMENFETLRSFEEGIRHYERLFRISPQVIAYDKHPDYLATRYALKRAETEGLQAIGIQHHHAHIASCLAENHWENEHPVIGIAFDGTGYGEDGTIWGGEILIASYTGFQRVYHLSYFPLPGGDVAIRQPWRVALSLLHTYQIPWERYLPPLQYLLGQSQEKMLELVERQIQHKINAPLTSSMGRLFDAVASLIGVRHTVNYEAQAAMELEALAIEPSTDEYHLEHMPSWSGTTQAIDLKPIIHQVLEDVFSKTPKAVIATKFHRTMAKLVEETCLAIRRSTGIQAVALSGGVWQNMVLLRETVLNLRHAGFQVLLHRTVPPNDGGISLGQAAVAAHVVR